MHPHAHIPVLNVNTWYHYNRCIKSYMLFLMFLHSDLFLFLFLGVNLKYSFSLSLFAGLHQQHYRCLWKVTVSTQWSAWAISILTRLCLLQASIWHEAWASLLFPLRKGSGSSQALKDPSKDTRPRVEPEYNMAWLVFTWQMEAFLGISRTEGAYRHNSLSAVL